MPLSAQAAFPGKNGLIAFQAELSNGRSQIFTVPADGGNLGVDRTQITDVPGFLWLPSWSADGSRLAVVGNRAGGDSRELYIAHADRSDLTLLDDQAAGNRAGWSPDGTEVAFHRGSLDLFALRLSGAGPCDGENGQGFCLRFLGNAFGGGIGGGNPDWSPDGRRVAYECDEHTLCMVNADGTGNVVLGPGLDPEWSPDSKRLLFSRWQPGSFRRDVYAIDPDGSNVVQLTDHPADDFRPVWSPDRSKIAFMTGRRLFTPDRPFPREDVYVMDAVAGEPQPLILSAISFDWQALPNRTPECATAVASRPRLHPANRRFTAVSVEGVSDPDGDPVTVSIDAVSQDERVTGPGDPTAPDARAGTAPDIVSLRSERSPRGDGRVYRVAFTASDGTASCTGTVRVEVRRHRAQPAIDSSPPLYDSAGE